MKLELSNKTVEIIDLKKKHVSNALKLSTIGNGTINNEVFLSLMENQIVKFSKIKFINRIKINNLSFKDGKKLRNAVKKILIDEGIWVETIYKSKPQFSNNEIEQFNKMKSILLIK